MCTDVLLSRIHEEYCLLQSYFLTAETSQLCHPKGTFSPLTVLLLFTCCNRDAWLKLWLFMTTTLLKETRLIQELTEKTVLLPTI